MKDKAVENNKHHFSGKQIFLTILKYLVLILVLYLMNFIFEQVIIQLSIKYKLEIFLKHGWNKINVNSFVAISTTTFAFFYLFFDILYLIKKNKVLKIITLLFDAIMLILSVLYFVQIIIAMLKAPGEAGFGFLFLPDSLTIFLYSFFSLKNKLNKNRNNKQELEK